MISKKRKIKALLLFSGGLDSILAAKILEKQGIKVTALFFGSHFFDSRQAKKSTQKNKIKLLTSDISSRHLAIVKNPRYGRGAGMNPCVDCHLLMLKEAKKIAQKGKYDIIATGEVLGQRPMSQNRETLKLIEKKARLVGKILRPLSARSLPETGYEKENLVNRGNLYGFSGRSRRGQMKLAKKFGVKSYPSPAGGCILTNLEYSKKLRVFLENIKNPKSSDLKLLRLGRHFWIGKIKIILGRNHKENLEIKDIAEKGDAIIEPKNFKGPLALVRKGKNQKAIRLAKEKIVLYSKKIKDKKPEFIFSEF